MSCKVMAAVLTWNDSENTRRALRSLQKQSYPELRIALVDNHSGDGSYEEHRKEFPAVEFVRYRENFGFGEGVNGALRAAIETQVDFLFFMDNDAEADPDAVSQLIHTAEREPSSVFIFPRVIHEKTQKEWCGAGTLLQDIQWQRSFFPGLWRNVPGVFLSEAPAARVYAGGFFMLRMSRVKEAGYLNPRYFIGWDEREWFLTAARRGLLSSYSPEARVAHRGGSTLNQVPRSALYYEVRNRLHFLKKHSAASPFMIYGCLFFLRSIFLTLPKLALAGRFVEIKGGTEGVLDFLRGKWGPRDFKRVTPSFVSRITKAAGRFLTQSSEAKKQSPPKNPKRIQVILDWNIGDEIMSNPVFEGLKRKFPDSRINAIVRFPQVLAGNPFVDSMNEGPTFSADWILDLHQEIRPRPRFEYLPELAGLSEWGRPRIYLTEAERQDARVKFGLKPGTRKVVINPEVWWLSRRWPRERWIELARRFEKKAGVQVLIVGNDDTAFPAGSNWVGKTSLRELAALIAECDLFIGHDSGPLYVAVAVQTPCVGLYGPLDPAMLFQSMEGFKPIWTRVECRGCWPAERMRYRDHCPKVVPDCMTSISGEEVWTICEDWLESGFQRKKELKHDGR